MQSSAAAHRSVLATQDACLIRAVSDVGDSWTLLITWAIAAGVTRFDALQRELGVARNILSERLRRQMRYGLVEKRPIAEGARRMEYRLTDKGAALAEALMALRDWAEAWGEPQEDGATSANGAAPNGDATKTAGRRQAPGAAPLMDAPRVDAPLVDTSLARPRVDAPPPGRAARGGGHGANDTRAASPE